MSDTVDREELETRLADAREEIARLERMLEMRPPVPCRLCWGLGETVRENRQGRLVCWPCPMECDHPKGLSIVKSHARRDRSR